MAAFFPVISIRNGFIDVHCNHGRLIKKFLRQDAMAKLIFMVAAILGSLAVSLPVAQAASVVLSWQRNQEPDIAGYKIYYGTKSHSYTDSITINDSANSPKIISYTVKTLSSGKTYYFAVKAFDLAHQFSPYSDEVSVHIPGSGSSGGSSGGSGGSSGVVKTLNYCSAQGSSQKYEWISRVQVGSFVNSSGPSGYGDFTSKTIELAAGKKVVLRLTPGFSGKAYDEHWRVWIDYNKDGDFNDAGELVYSGHGLGAVSGGFTVRSSASGVVRMRVSMQYKSYPSSACGTMKYGEVEDYTVSFGGSAVGSGSSGVVKTLNYCSAQGSSQKYEWISRVQVGSFVNSSGPSGYGDFTSKTIELAAGKKVVLRLTPGFSGKAYDEHWRVWIDYNKDGDFNDAGELVYSGHGLGAVSGGFTVRSSASGVVRMRVSMQYKSYPSSACGTMKYGEVEDYTVSFK